MVHDPDRILLPLETWVLRAKNHAALVSPFADAFAKRRDTLKKHPVHDFLFCYYTFSPLKLKQWLPSFKEDLTINQKIRKEYPWLNDHLFHLKGNILSFKMERLNQKTRSLAAFIARLCTNILQRPHNYCCYGLHEWAMIHRQSPLETRHSSPLRLAPENVSLFVESQPLSCSHYDAYRFFTPEARPLNTLKPRFETRLQMEQGGCIHANMDLYKWAGKLWPWIGSDFIAKAFMLALEARELDMRASPYDLREEGYAPICIETEEGRRHYQKEQRLLAERAAILRKELFAFCEKLILKRV